MRIDAIGVEKNYSGMKMQVNTNNSMEASKEAKDNDFEQMSNEVEVVKNQKTQEQDIINAIEKANKHIRTYDRKLEFSIHESTKQIMVKVINTEDDTVVREIPSEKVLDMVAHMWEVAGILIDERR